MNKSPSTSKDAFAKAASPQEPKPTKQAESEQINFVPDPMSFTISGTQGGKSKVVIEDQNGTFEAEFIPEMAQKPPLNLNTDDISLDWQEEGYRILLKQEDGPSDMGIDGGRITRLVMVDDKENTVNFDNGEWAEEPSLPIEYALVDKVKSELNGVHDQEVDEAPDITTKNDPDHDI
ncbi:MAG: hypothetical protein ABJR46_15025 [Tateyamaria sp.]|uniref:DUF7678 domain-containing protein n=1 Tax=Tateyamaria sp. TaxID=1929288 RepID=UPI00329CE323